jgi:protein-S-isoprenylcysteine O-methyltransferase Ste14
MNEVSPDANHTLSTKTIGQLSRHNEKTRRRVIAAFFAGLLALVVLELGLFNLFEDLGLPMIDLGLWNMLLGLPLITLGSVWVLWSVSEQYSIGKGTPAPRVATQQLVISGPYRFSRNPMTFGALGLYLGLAIWNGSWVAMGMVLLIFSALLSYIYVFETRELTARFGKVFLDYKKDTPFLFPKIGKNFFNQSNREENVK